MHYRLAKTLQQKGRRLWDNKEGGLDGKKLHKMKIKRCLKLLFRQTLYALVDFEWEVRVLFMVLFCLHYAPQTKHVFSTFFRSASVNMF